MARRRVSRAKEEKPHHGHHITAIVILILIALLGALGYLFYTANAPHVQQKLVIVSGTANTIGISTQPTSITFGYGAQRFSSTITGNRYAIILPDQRTYNVSISWRGLGGISFGTCGAVLLGLSTNATTYQFNITC